MLSREAHYLPICHIGFIHLGIAITHDGLYSFEDFPLQKIKFQIRLISLENYWILVENFLMSKNNYNKLSCKLLFLCQFYVHLKLTLVFDSPQCTKGCNFVIALSFPQSYVGVKVHNRRIANGSFLNVRNQVTSQRGLQFLCIFPSIRWKR